MQFLVTLNLRRRIDLVQLRNSRVRFGCPLHQAGHVRFSLARIGCWTDMKLAVSASCPGDSPTSRYNGEESDA